MLFIPDFLSRFFLSVAKQGVFFQYSFIYLPADKLFFFRINWLETLNSLHWLKWQKRKMYFFSKFFIASCVNVCDFLSFLKKLAMHLIVFFSFFKWKCWTVMKCIIKVRLMLNSISYCFSLYKRFRQLLTPYYNRNVQNCSIIEALRYS